MDKTKERLDVWCSAQNIEFADQEAEKAYKQRAKRVTDVIQLKVPDRVPIVPAFGMFPALNNGYTCEEVMFDSEKAQKAWLKTVTDFKPDLFSGSGYAYSGSVLEALDYKQLKLPGRGIDPSSVYQSVEKEYVSAEEFYDPFIDDPSDFMLRTYLPRVCGIFEPFKKIPPLTSWFAYYISIAANTASFGLPEMVSSLESLVKAGKEALKWRRGLVEEAVTINGMGYPSMFGGNSAAPYDIIGDWFRGTRGIMLDIYRHPKKLLIAMDRLVPMLIQMGVQGAKRSGNPIIGMMLHKGLDGFMSPEQYKTFYWPSFRKVMMGLIDEGLVPSPLFEGENTSRLEIIKDIPRGKAIYWFETVDIFKAKEILGDTVCFRGNVPGSLLALGTPRKVEDYVKKLIDVVGKGGGLIVDCGLWFNEAQHDNVKAMIDITKEYGRYTTP